MLEGLKRVARAGWLFREVRSLRREVAGLRVALEQVAQALQVRNAHEYPVLPPPDPGVPAVEVAFVNDVVAAEFMAIELALTEALGHVPTEEEVAVEYDRRHPLQAEAFQ